MKKDEYIKSVLTQLGNYCSAQEWVDDINAFAQKYNLKLSDISVEIDTHYEQYDPTPFYIATLSADVPMTPEEIESKKELAKKANAARKEHLRRQLEQIKKELGEE